MDSILIILKKENGPRASSAAALGLNTIIFKHVYWYMQQISDVRLQDQWSSGTKASGPIFIKMGFLEFMRKYSCIENLYKQKLSRGSEIMKIKFLQ